MAVYQAGDLNCHLNNYSLMGAMASHCLNSLCKYQQTFLRKYPVTQGAAGEVEPKALCHVRVSRRRHFSAVTQPEALCLPVSVPMAWLEGEILLPGKTSLRVIAGV